MLRLSLARDMIHPRLLWAITAYDVRPKILVARQSRVALDFAARDDRTAQQRLTSASVPASSAHMSASVVDDEALREWKKAREVERLNAQQKQESNETVRLCTAARLTRCRFRFAYQAPCKCGSLSSSWWSYTVFGNA